MKLFVELTLTDFFISISNEKGMVDFIHEEGLKEKSDYLPLAFEKLLSRNNLKAKDINQLYVTKGPGSFMGIRAGLMFVKTLAQMLDKPLYTTDNFTFIAKGKDGVYYLDAKTNESFKGEITNGKATLSLVSFEPSSSFDYKDIINNINEYLSLFNKEDLNDAMPLYLKEPKIG